LRRSFGPVAPAEGSGDEHSRGHRNRAHEQHTERDAPADAGSGAVEPDVVALFRLGRRIGGHGGVELAVELTTDLGERPTVVLGQRCVGVHVLTVARPALTPAAARSHLGARS
jgi:hypothetical protein